MRSLSHRWLSENELRRRPENQKKAPKGLRKASSHDRLFYTDRSSEVSSLSPAQVLLGPSVFKFDGGSDRTLRGYILKKPVIPPRTSSRHALTRSHSAEISKSLVTIEETPERRGSSVSSPSERHVQEYTKPHLPERDINVVNAIPASPPVGASPEITITINLDTHGRNTHTPKYLTPLVDQSIAPHVAPQISIQPALATPVLIVPNNGKPLDIIPAVDDGRIRRISTRSIDPFADTESSFFHSRLNKPASSALPGPNEHTTEVAPDSSKRHSRHVGWKSGLLETTAEEEDDFVPLDWGTRRRSTSLPDLTSDGKEMRSVKGRRATPWVHSLGQRAIFSSYNSKGEKRPFPILKKLSVSSTSSTGSVKTVDSGFEVWFDAKDHFD